MTGINVRKDGLWSVWLLPTNRTTPCVSFLLSYCGSIPSVALCLPHVLSPLSLLSLPLCVSPTLVTLLPTSPIHSNTCTLYNIYFDNSSTALHTHTLTHSVTSILILYDICFLNNGTSNTVLKDGKIM